MTKKYIKNKNKKRRTLNVNLHEREFEMLTELRQNFDINFSELVRNEIERAYIENIIKPVYDGD